MTYRVQKPVALETEKTINSIASDRNPTYWTVWTDNNPFAFGEVVGIFPEKKDAEDYARMKNLMMEIVNGNSYT